MKNTDTAIDNAYELLSDCRKPDALTHNEKLDYLKTALEYVNDSIKELKAHKIEIDTREYFNSHGKDPRGMGLWAFAPDDPDENYKSNKTIWVNGTFPKACLEAIKIAKETLRTQCYTLYVLS